jgi:hypothetical protein
MVLTLHLCVLYRAQIQQQKRLAYMTVTDSFCITVVESVSCVVTH